MAHESFEDPEVAAVMNRLFVNVKVDREERPDVDAIYMQAVQAMTGRGGWPMTVFLAPDGRPFFGGTYFPKDDRQGMAGFGRVMTAIDEAWRTKRDELLENAGALEDVIARSTAVGATGDPSRRRRSSTRRNTTSRRSSTPRTAGSAEPRSSPRR